MQVCSAIICGTALGEVFEERREHNQESSILRLRPEDSSGDSLGGHGGHAHTRQRDGGQDKKHNGVENHEEREHHGHKHHVHQEAAGHPEEFTLRKAHDDHDHNQREAYDGHEAFNDHGHHRSISPEMQRSVQQRLQNPAKKHDHKHNENKHEHEYKENKEKAEIMSEFVALEKGLGGIHRYFVHNIIRHIFISCHRVLERLNILFGCSSANIRKNATPNCTCFYLEIVAFFC